MFRTPPRGLQSSAGEATKAPRGGPACLNSVGWSDKRVSASSIKRREERRVVEVRMVRRAPVKARMGTGPVVPGQIPADRGPRLGDAVVGPEVDLLVLDRSPQPLDEDVVPPGALAVHADGDLGLGEHGGEGLRRELRSPRLRGGRLWSVLKISGRPWRASASSIASMQNAASIVIETRQLKIRRENQSTTAAR